MKDDWKNIQLSKILGKQGTNMREIVIRVGKWQKGIPDPTFYLYIIVYMPGWQASLVLYIIEVF